jgi:Leucine-rich repeat (LRR) protein
LQTPRSNLKAISLAGSPLRSIPSSILQNWKHLNSLWLSSTNLTDFPMEILNMEDLEVLALDSNDISTIPPTLHLLPYLNWIYLESNNISVFPDTLVTSRRGVYLYLNHNPIEFIPDSVAVQIDPFYVGLSSTVYCQAKHHHQPLDLCQVDCSESCSRPDWGNFYCDPKCNSTECQYDNGDCAF